MLVPVLMLKIQVAPPGWSLRFFDCQVVFDDKQGSTLPPFFCRASQNRQRASSSLYRRRDKVKWPGTSLAPFLMLDSHDDFTQIQQIKAQILLSLERKNMSATDLALVIDTNHDQVITISEFLEYLKSLRGMPQPAILERLKHSLLVVADRRMDGQISFQELEEFLSN